MYVLCGGVVEEGGDGKLTSEGGSRKCMLVKDRMGVEVQRIVMENIGSDLSEHQVWYNLKYDRQMLMPVKGDMDVRMIFKGNDEHSV